MNQDEFKVIESAFSIDYPHPDRKFLHAVERFLSLPSFMTAKRKLLWDNCARLYAME